MNTITLISDVLTVKIDARANSSSILLKDECVNINKSRDYVS